MEESRSARLLETLIDAYFVNHSLEQVLDCLSEDACWTGPFSGQGACGREEIATLLRREFLAQPQARQPHLQRLQEQSVVPQAVLVWAELWLGSGAHSPDRQSIRVSAVCRLQDDCAHICSIEFALAPWQGAVPAAFQGYAALLQAAPGGMAVLGVQQDGALFGAFASDGLGRMLQMTQEELETLYGPDVYKGLPVQDAARIREKFRRAYSSHASVSENCRMRTGAGTYLWVSLQASFVQRLSDTVYYYVQFSDVEELKQSELRAELAREKMRLLLENSALETWEYDIGTKRFVLGKRAHGRYAAGEVLENAPACLLQGGFVRAESRGAYRALHAAVERGVPHAEAEIWFGTADTPREQHVLYALRYVTVYDAQGAPATALGIGEDITVRRAVEKSYRESMDYRTILDSQSIMTFRINLTDNWCGDGHADLPELLTLQDASTVDAFLEALAQRMEDPLERIEFRLHFGRKQLLNGFAQGRQEFSIEHRFRLWNDTQLWLHFVVRLLRHPSSGKVEGIAYAQDVTARKRAQGLLESVVNSELDQMMDVDLSTEQYYLYAGTNGEGVPAMAQQSENYYEYLKRFAEEAVAQEDIPIYLDSLHPGTVRRLLRKQDSYEFTFCLRAHDATERRYKRVRVFYSDRAAGFVCFVRSDVTDMVRSEQQKQQALQKALQAERDANRLKSDFLSHISHDVRTPMNAILGLITLAQRKEDDPAAMLQTLKKMEDSARYLLLLLSDILDMSRIESGKMQLRCAPFSLPQFLLGVESVAGSLAAQTGVQLSVWVEPNVGQSFFADTLKLQQVLVNLLSNAVKFTPAHGLVSLRVRRLPNVQDKAQLQFSVDDNGIGIEPEFLPRLFEPFSQEYSRRTAHYTGTGLGLAICKSIVEQMQGSISVQSSPSAGTCFVATVLLGERRLCAPATAPQSPQAQPRFDGLRVLLAEDHPINAEVAKGLLEHQGFAVEVAQNGRQALDLFERSTPGQYSLVLMDLRMPVMDGMTAAMRIRRLARPDAQSIPIVAMTANGPSEESPLLRASGMDAYLVKPIEPDTLFEVLTDVLRTAQQEE